MDVSDPTLLVEKSPKNIVTVQENGAPLNFDPKLMIEINTLLPNQRYIVDTRQSYCGISINNVTYALRQVDRGNNNLYTCHLEEVKSNGKKDGGVTNILIYKYKAAELAIDQSIEGIQKYITQILKLEDPSLITFYASKLESIEDEKLRVSAIKIFRVREKLELDPTFKGWQEAIGPGSDPKKTLEFYERIFHSLGLNDRVVSQTKKQIVDQYSKPGVYQTGKGEIELNDQDIELLKEIFEKGDQSILSLNNAAMDGIDKDINILVDVLNRARGIDPTAEINLDAAINAYQKTIKVLEDRKAKVGRIINDYYASLQKHLNQDAVRSLNEITQVALGYVDFDITKPRQNIAVLEVGDIGAGKGTTNAQLGVVPFATGTDGISKGTGESHEHFGLVVKSFRWALDIGGFMAIVEPLTSMGLVGYRRNLDQNGLEDAPVYLDGVIRSKSQAKLLEGMTEGAVGVYMRITPETAIKRNISRVVEHLDKNNGKIEGLRGDALSDLEVLEEGGVGNLLVQLYNEIKKDEMSVEEVIQSIYDKSQEPNIGLRFKDTSRFSKYQKDLPGVAETLRTAGIVIKEIQCDGYTPEEVTQKFVENIGINNVPNAEKGVRALRKAKKTTQTIVQDGYKFKIKGERLPNGVMYFSPTKAVDYDNEAEKTAYKALVSKLASAYNPEA